MKKIILALMCCLCTNAYAKRLQDDAVLKWVGVEVVTKDFSSVGKIRELTKITPGMTAAITNPALPQACRNIREAYPLEAVNCQAISMEGGTALYAVEISSKNISVNQNTFRCNKNSFLPKRLKNLEAHSFQIFDNYLKKPNSIAANDIINNRNALDSTEPELSTQLNKISIELQDQIDALRKGVSSCKSEDRAAAIQLFNYSGKPTLATEIATNMMLDPDSHVRNNATRLLSVFAKFIPSHKHAQLMINACKLIDRPSFTDRNKGLALIAQLSKENNWDNTIVPQACLNTIKEIQRVSISEQLGGYADSILKQIEP